MCLKDDGIIQRHCAMLGNPPWNMVVGSGGSELRISPITEIDIDFNFFSAEVRYQFGPPTRKIHFKVRAMAINQGLVYPGAYIMLNMPTFVSLPSESITFKWYLEKEPNILPSNMQASPSGSVLTISELRKEQEGVVACAVYTNLGILATQKRFRIQQVDENNNKLIFTATRPPTRFLDINRWRKQQESRGWRIDGKRDASKSSQLRNEILKKLHLLENSQEFTKALLKNSFYAKRRKKRSLQVNGFEMSDESPLNVQDLLETNTGFYYNQENQIGLASNAQDNYIPPSRTKKSTPSRTLQSQGNRANPKQPDLTYSIGENQSRRLNQLNNFVDAKSQYNNVKPNRRFAPSVDLNLLRNNRQMDDSLNAMGGDIGEVADVNMAGPVGDGGVMGGVTGGGMDGAVADSGGIAGAAGGGDVDGAASGGMVGPGGVEGIGGGVGGAGGDIGATGGPNIVTGIGASLEAVTEQVAGTAAKIGQETAVNKDIGGKVGQGAVGNVAVGTGQGIIVTVDPSAGIGQSLGSASVQQGMGVGAQQGLSATSGELGIAAGTISQGVDPIKIANQPNPQINMYPESVQEIAGIETEISIPEVQIQERDLLSMLIAECSKDSQCSLNAECVRRPEKAGFCRCLPKFEGNGIFCWENYKFKL
ncbi:uncharacterized protein CDAR_523201 [Caerostris darwini]|uniref:EGF-like domain-containing protein n=1 Tax=Caerostris darwini TaxID=1538125 RepID=A0AAV4U959_9ARAC|nr:uncharacterized protein CDAR_523201 [Caerostris darwini]